MPKTRYGKTASGAPITDELIDRLAKRAEAGYDVDQTIRRRRGRPPIGSGPASVESVRLEPELRVALRQRADDDGTTTSAVIREALRGHLMGDQAGPRVELGHGRSLPMSELPVPLVACVNLIDFLNARDRFILDTPLQQLVVATVVRSSGTFKGICSMLVDELPAQAAMLCRPLFEDLVVAHWIVLNAHDCEWLIRRFTNHRDAMALYQADLVERTGWRFGEPLANDPRPLRRRQNQLFNEFGGEAQKNWWDPGELGRGKGAPVGIRGVAEQLERAAERHERYHPRLAGGQESLLSRMELVAYKWFNQSLHHTALGLPIEVVDPGAVPGVLGDPSAIVCFSAWWMFSQQLYLLHDLYGQDSSDLDDLVRLTLLEVFGASEEDLHRPKSQ